MNVEVPESKDLQEDLLPHIRVPQRPSKFPQRLKNLSDEMVITKAKILTEINAEIPQAER